MAVRDRASFARLDKLMKHIPQSAVLPSWGMLWRYLQYSAESGERHRSLAVAAQ
jgi:hypothetical protein